MVLLEELPCKWNIHNYFCVIGKHYIMLYIVSVELHTHLYYIIPRVSLCEHPIVKVMLYVCVCACVCVCVCVCVRVCVCMCVCMMYLCVI